MTAPALWELMYFGKTSRDRYPATARLARRAADDPDDVGAASGLS